MVDRAQLLVALELVTDARRIAQHEYDDALTAHLTAPTDNQELPQTLAALVRQLDAAGRELADAIRTCDQRDRVASR